jgi:hypothetical protein
MKTTITALARYTVLTCSFSFFSSLKNQMFLKGQSHEKFGSQLENSEHQFDLNYEPATVLKFF